MVAIGIVLYITDILYYRKRNATDHPAKDEEKPGATEPAEEPAADTDGEVCCGMHTVCEKTNLSPDRRNRLLRR